MILAEIHGSVKMIVAVHGPAESEPQMNADKRG